MQSVPITTKVVSSNPVHGELYSIQHYVVKFVGDLRLRWFSLDTPVSFINKNEQQAEIAEILLKVALNTITRPLLHGQKNEHRTCLRCVQA